MRETLFYHCARHLITHPGTCPACVHEREVETAPPLTEADIRRIIHEELTKVALARKRRKRFLG